MRCVVFFFQAEDGIRDYKVTGVQTCALPILGNGNAFSDLIGNVSEMVFDVPAKLPKLELRVPRGDLSDAQMQQWTATLQQTVQKRKNALETSQDQLFVVGGSCISPPEVGFAKQPCGM